jgi:hypothetical protein
MTKEKMYTAKEMAEFIEDMVEDGILSHNGKWINNEVPLWKDVVKPCKLCGFCPYGQLVEEYPLPPMTRAEEIEWIENIKKKQAEGAYDEENKVNGLPLMTREEAQKHIDEFNPNDYPENPDEQMEKMSCSVFGHCCPVFFQMELFAEEDEATDEEMDLCDKEIYERCTRMMKEE